MALHLLAVGGVSCQPNSNGGKVLPGRVLVIDDDTSFREALSELLRGEGLQVHTADRAATAIDELETTTFDVVLSDLIMPGNGHLVVEYVGSHQPGTPVIVITSHESPYAILARANETAFACLQKPVRFDQIREALKRAFEYRHAYSA